MYPTPELEEHRIWKLKATQILDTAPNAAFDALVQHVRDLFKVPICLISLVDTERQWFKAVCGLDTDHTSRDVAFCNYTIMRDEVFVVEDARADPRFAENLLVTGEPYIRFYAGAPLLVEDGVSLGSLCVIGTEPRTITPEEALVLRRMATVVVALIEGHSLAEQALRLAEEAASQRQIAEDSRHALERLRRGEEPASKAVTRATGSA